MWERHVRLTPDALCLSGMNAGVSRARPDEIESFASHLNRLAEMYAFAPLVDYAARLQSQLHNFELDQCHQTLQEFPQLMENWLALLASAYN